MDDDERGLLILIVFILIIFIFGWIHCKRVNQLERQRAGKYT